MLSFPFFNPTPESLVRRLQDLPPEPRVLLALQRLLATRDTPFEEIAAVVALEPGLSARVVKMASSVHFGRGVKVESLMEAIQRVGERGVQEVVTYAVASQLVGRPLTTYRLGAQHVWARAVACAIAAGALAERSDVSYEEAYTAGLMHGLGLVVIDRYATAQRNPRTLNSAGYPLDFAPEEREWLGFSHAEAGAALLEMWNFTPSVVAAVRYQLEPENAGEHRKLAMVLATARWARSLFCVPHELIPELPTEQWLEEAGMPIADFGPWLSKVRNRYMIARDELRLK